MPPLRLLFLAAVLPLAAFAASRPPNFLFVFTDDQRWDAMGVVQREQGDKGRFPWFTTPHMDRLAAEGMRFRNAFVTNSLCAPSRAVFMTGRHSHHNGIVNNHTPFAATNVTHATVLRGAGYATAYIGKWHMGSQSGQRPTFDYSASFVGQGRYVDCPIEVNGVATPSKGWVDDVTTDYAIDYMRKNRDRPFSIMLGFKACHGPFDPPERAKERFAGARARTVPNMAIRATYRDEDAPAFTKAKAAAQSGAEADVNLGYFRCISAADDNLGRLLAALDELKLADDTVVIYSSDNGYYHGEHGLGDKRSAYDESLRIPLLVRYPRLVAKGAVRDEMVLNLDLAPTLIDLAGAKVPAEMQGRSWKPLLAGERAPWRESFFYCYFFEANFPTTPTTTALRTQTAKLIKYPGRDDWTELFDLSADPYELKNLWRDPAHAALRAKLSTEYDAQAKATGFHIPDYADKPGDAAAKKKSKKKQQE